jgi:hypothetical protein
MNKKRAAPAIDSTSVGEPPIRAVLESLATRRQLPDSFCWCEKPKWDSLKTHEARCDAAKELYAASSPSLQADAAPKGTELSQQELEGLSGKLIVESLPRFGNGKIIESELAGVFDNLLRQIRAAAATNPAGAKCVLCGHIKLSPWRGYCKHERKKVNVFRHALTKYCGCKCEFAPATEEEVDDSLLLEKD